MHLSTIVVPLFSASLLVAQNYQVAAPWHIQDLRISNIRHGTGGTWSFDILDYPTATATAQAINTTCRYYDGSTYYFASNGPVNAPCDDTTVSFSLYEAGSTFRFNVTHLWECGTDNSTQQCNDNGTWAFSRDDVRGQESSPRNNFGQSGGFYRSAFDMYPNRAVPKTEPEW